MAAAIALNEAPRPSRIRWCPARARPSATRLGTRF